MTGVVANDAIEDVIIIGGGAAGLTAALYAARRGLRTLVLTQDIGGQASTTSEIENYPGVDRIDGLELMERFRRQAERFGAVVKLEEVRRIERPDDMFLVHSSAGRYRSRSVILGFGLTHTHLNVPGEQALIGKGVVFCATCDAPLYRGQAVAVIGGGNSALDAALLTAKLCRQVDLLTKNDELRGEQILIDRVLAAGNVRVHYGATTTEVLGRERVTGLRFRDAGGRDHELSVGGVFVEIGFTVNPALVRDLIELDGRNQIITTKDNGTSVPGLFAAGDVTTISEKQVVVSAGEGAKAALAAYRYLQTLGVVKRGAPIDWGTAAPAHHGLKE